MCIRDRITAENAAEYLDAGASHVIVTSYVFQNGRMNRENLQKLKSAVGKEHIVLDVSCRKREGAYYIVTDRWQNFTEVKLDAEILDELAGYCSEYLVPVSYTHLDHIIQKEKSCLYSYGYYSIKSDNCIEIN